MPLPFTLALRPGRSLHAQVVQAVTKAVVTGQLRPGDPFPSVRALSQELRVNPNTAQRVVATLVERGLLDSRPGIGTSVAEWRPAPNPGRRALLAAEVERVVIEARHLGLGLSELLAAVRQAWRS